MIPLILHTHYKLNNTDIDLTLLQNINNSYNESIYKHYINLSNNEYEDLENL